MAHAIEHLVETDANGNKTEVDCFSYVGDRPWHGLGQRLGEKADPNVTRAQMESAARADWQVTTDRVKTASDDLILDGVKALLRAKDRKALGFTTQKYGVIQHQRIGELLDELVQSKRATWETVGVLNEGQRVFYTVRLKNVLAALPGDETEMFVAGTTSHDGTASANFLLTGTRIVCQNTLSLAMNQNMENISVRHTKNAETNFEKLREMLMSIDQNVKSVDEGMKMLTQIVMTETQAQKFLDIVHPVKDLPSMDVFERFGKEKQERMLYERDLAVRVQAKLVELHETGAGADIRGVRGTGYGWLNACTNYATHVMSSKSKLESLMVGDAAKMGRRAYAALTDRSTREKILAAV